VPGVPFTGMIAARGKCSATREKGKEEETPRKGRRGNPGKLHTVDLDEQGSGLSWKKKEKKGPRDRNFTGKRREGHRSRC